jgi:hypothetical protein
MEMNDLCTDQKEINKIICEKKTKTQKIQSQKCPRDKIVRRKVREEKRWCWIRKEY